MRLLILLCTLGMAVTEEQGMVATTTGEQRIAKNAWVTIYYEAGKNDDEYFLAARVLMQSIKDSGSEADRVVLIAKGTQARYAKGFQDDGVKLIWVDNIESPWTQTLQRFAFSLNKLRIWDLTQYNKVIFLDADVVVLQHADFLFNCGDFCAVFFNPISFHTAILVVKPDHAVFTDMIQKLNTLKSFDGADQGFINSYFENFNAAPEWTRDKPPSTDRMNRLPVPYNMHHIYYYEKMSWGGPWGKAEDIVTMTYPIATFGKPWWWWCYPLMDMHWLWLKFRNRVDSYTDYPWQILLLVAAPVVHFLLVEIAKKQHTSKAPPPLPTDADPDNRPGVWFTWGKSSCTAVIVGVVLSGCSLIVGRVVTPGITPPGLAWPLFLTYYALCLYHSAAFLFKRVYSVRLRLEWSHCALWAAPWVIFFASASYPSYPHGLVKLVWIVISLLTSAGCNVALFKMVHDSNLRRL
eukprot:TRINITY_DN15650_c1_g1_i1.p1 TRINITY_DN15650_c1_g1~~TRINITY_DN15650_c1_g1_i1.p1  ORF type:complete len:464 (+),score=98.96 TRINITY_DN15650_c1_g1_i1:77-1468(+)